MAREMAGTGLRHRGAAEIAGQPGDRSAWSEAKAGTAFPVDAEITLRQAPDHQGGA